MTFRGRFLLISALFLACLPACAIPDEAPARAAAAPVAFTPGDRQLISDFYHRFAFPPDLANPAIIAADLQKRLEVTGKVPPDLAALPLPVSLEEKLSPLPPGYVRFRAGTAVILMDVRSREVIDQVQLEFR